MEHLKPLLPAGGDASELEAAAQALAGLSPEDRDLLAAVQESPFRLTTLEQFREFPANTEYFILEPNIRKVEDVGWRYARAVSIPASRVSGRWCCPVRTIFPSVPKSAGIRVQNSQRNRL